MKNTTILVRTARKFDEKAITRCFVELENYERMIEPRRQPGEQIAAVYVGRLIKQCSEKDGRIFVATDEGQMVGFVAVYPNVVLDEQINEPTTVAYISELVVTSDSRKRGVGQLLMTNAEKYVRDKGIKTIMVNVLAANDAANKFYRNNGYVDYEKTVIKRLK